jgi:hypothetical protein
MAMYGWMGLLVVLGAMNIWFARSPRLKFNPAAFRIARFISLRGIRALLFWGGVLMLVLGLVGLGLALTGASG